MEPYMIKVPTHGHTWFKSRHRAYMAATHIGARQPLLLGWDVHFRLALEAPTAKAGHTASHTWARQLRVLGLAAT